MSSNYESKKGMKILVVDDFPTQRKLMKRTLLDLGFENVIEAVDGVDALEKLHTGDVEFIICDWHMPKMMGIDLPYSRPGGSGRINDRIVCQQSTLPGGWPERHRYQSGSGKRLQSGKRSLGPCSREPCGSELGNTPCHGRFRRWYIRAAPWPQFLSS